MRNMKLKNPLDIKFSVADGKKPLLEILSRITKNLPRVDDQLLEILSGIEKNHLPSVHHQLMQLESRNVVTNVMGMYHRDAIAKLEAKFKTNGALTAKEQEDLQCSQDILRMGPCNAYHKSGATELQNIINSGVSLTTKEKDDLSFSTDLLQHGALYAIEQRRLTYASAKQILFPPVQEKQHDEEYVLVNEEKQHDDEYVFVNKDDLSFKPR